MYRPTRKSVWAGRADGPGQAHQRWHQVVRLHNLNKKDLPPPDARQKGIALLGFCSDEGVIRNEGREGAWAGPLAIRKSLANLPVNFGSRVRLVDAGDIICNDEKLEKAQKELYPVVTQIVKAGYTPVLLGGGHEIAWPHYTGLQASLRRKTLGVINFDAHFDLRNYSTGGHSGSSFLQIADRCKKDKKRFRYLCIGVQDISNTKYLFDTADFLHVEYVYADEVTGNDGRKAANAINRFMKSVDYVYVTLCMDVFSAAYAPGVSAPNPIGVYPERIASLIRQLAEKNVLSFDVAEMNPEYDSDGMTARLAAAMIFNFVAGLTARKR